MSPAGRGFLIFAESEFHKSLDGIKADFEKLLYVRAPCKVYDVLGSAAIACDSDR